MLFNTACVYGGPSNTLDDCGNNYSAINAGGGAAFGASYDVGNGFTTAFGYTGSETGLMTEEGDDAYAAQVTYSGDNYGVSFTYAYKENPTFTQTVTDGDVYALNDVDLNISDGEYFVLLGPSGGGKTTLLRSIGGFIRPDSGSVVIKGKNVNNLPPDMSFTLWPNIGSPIDLSAWASSSTETFLGTNPATKWTWATFL